MKKAKMSKLSPTPSTRGRIVKNNVNNVSKDFIKCCKCDMYGNGESFVEVVCKNCIRISNLEMKLEEFLAKQEDKSGPSSEEQALLAEAIELKTKTMIEEKLSEILKPGSLSENMANVNSSESTMTDTACNTIELKTIKEKVIKVEEKLREADLQEQRKNNVIIHRIAESGASTEDLKRIDDKTVTLQLFKDVLQVNCDNSDIKRIFRLGKFTGKDRPLLIEFKDGRTKNQIMESLSKLKNAEERFKTISICHDMTESERIQCRTLVKEAKDKQAADQSGEWLYRVRGVPGNMRIVKLRKMH